MGVKKEAVKLTVYALATIATGGLAGGWATVAAGTAAIRLTEEAAKKVISSLAEN